MQSGLLPYGTSPAFSGVGIFIFGISAYRLLTSKKNRDINVMGLIGGGMLYFIADKQAKEEKAMDNGGAQ